MKEAGQTCCACGYEGRAHQMGLISSAITAPHRWMCRDRRSCLARQKTKTEGNLTDAVYASEQGETVTR